METGSIIVLSVIAVVIIVGVLWGLSTVVTSQHAVGGQATCDSTTKICQTHVEYIPWFGAPWYGWSYYPFFPYSYGGYYHVFLHDEDEEGVSHYSTCAGCTQKSASNPNGLTDDDEEKVFNADDKVGDGPVDEKALPSEGGDEQNEPEEETGHSDESEHIGDDDEDDKGIDTDHATSHSDDEAEDTEGHSSGSGESDEGDEDSHSSSGGGGDEEGGGESHSFGGGGGDDE
jgi:uncharacterized membrane protein YgcG